MAPGSRLRSRASAARADAAKRGANFARKDPSCCAAVGAAFIENSRPRPQSREGSSGGTTEGLDHVVTHRFRRGHEIDITRSVGAVSYFEVQCLADRLLHGCFDGVGLGAFRRRCLLLRGWYRLGSASSSIVTAIRSPPFNPAVSRWLFLGGMPVMPPIQAMVLR